MTKSIFLEVLKAKEDAVFWDGPLFFAMLDRFPVAPGHALLIPKRQVLSIFDLNIDEKARFFDALFEAKKALPWNRLRDFYSRPIDQKSSIELCAAALRSPYLREPTEDFNFGLNEGVHAGRSVPHLHFHMIPRHKGDQERPKGGVRGVFPEKRNY